MSFRCRGGRFRSILSRVRDKTCSGDNSRSRAATGEKRGSEAGKGLLDILRMEVNVCRTVHVTVPP